MTFAQLITEVTTGTDRFTTAQANSAARWVQFSYGQVWTSENWSFRQGVVTNCTTTPNTVTLGGTPADIGAVSGIWTDEGNRLIYLVSDDFFNLYTDGTVTGTPYHYTVINGVVYLGPTPNASSSAYRLTYEKAPTQLTDDTDIPSLPSEYHYLLVPGALAIGLALFNDFTFQFMRETYLTGLASMRADYLTDIYGEIQQAGAYRPELWGTTNNRVE